MSPVGFEPTIAVLERAKTVRASDRSTTAIGSSQDLRYIVGVNTASTKRRWQVVSGGSW
jgi:hypothetical protein